ncbi:hypothetical protein R3P38DRAFT_2760950 [Favolaschia claudopus]|uniref:FTP domain-containing protein n=1 Tax=Favolaschia claudopus TaxID=2862362 RepID=A0AAW0DW24_9AGAR
MSIFPLVLIFAACFDSSQARRSLKAPSQSTETFFPTSSYQTFQGGVEHPLLRRGASLADTASSFVQSQLKIDSRSVKFKSGYSSDVAQYAYIKQQHNNISFANAVANVAFKDGRVVAFGHSFTKPSSIASSTPSVSTEAAISAAEKALGATSTLAAFRFEPGHSECKWFNSSDEPFEPFANCSNRWNQKSRRQTNRLNQNVEVH